MVRGQPVLQMPQDLYIPPDALEVILEAFEGPLDLLLYLIRRQNLDILDIPIAEITRQYVEYIELMHELRLELAADYLVMAAMLAEIKSRLLLPRPPLEEGLEDDPRAELVRRLQEYERFKKAAEEIEAMPRQDRDFATVSAFVVDRNVIRLPPPVELRELLLALKDVLKRAELTGRHAIQREALSVRNRMSDVLKALGDGEFHPFEHLFNRRRRPSRHRRHVPGPARTGQGTPDRNHAERTAGADLPQIAARPDILRSIPERKNQQAAIHGRRVVAAIDPDHENQEAVIHDRTFHEALTVQ